MRKRILSIVLAVAILLAMLPALTVGAEAATHTVVMTADEFIGYLKTALSRKNVYDNSYPRNLGYYDGNTISWDCWNLGKSILWSRGSIVNNYSIGTYARPDTSIGLGDWDGLTIIQQAPNCGSDFSNLVPGEWLYLSGHTGYYIGNGQVIECTTSWGVDGITYSQIDSYGNRSRNGVFEGKWLYHGKVPWIEYCSNHSYNNVGFCPACKTEFNWQATFNTNCAGIYTVTKSGGIYLRTDKPYAASTSKSELIVEGTDVDVLGSVTNHYEEGEQGKHRWYKVSYNGIIGYTHDSHLTWKKQADRKPTAVCDEIVGKAGGVYIRGWAFDPDTPAESLAIHVYIDDILAGTCTANTSRPDVNNVYGCGDNHGFSATIPFNVSSTGTHSVVVFALNTEYGRDPTGMGPYSVTISSGHVHSYGSWITTKAATCEESGIQQRECNQCGEAQSQTIPALDHYYQSDNICFRCGKKNPHSIDFEAYHMQLTSGQQYIFQSVSSGKRINVPASLKWTWDDNAYHDNHHNGFVVAYTADGTADQLFGVYEREPDLYSIHPAALSAGHLLQVHSNEGAICQGMRMETFPDSSSYRSWQLFNIVPVSETEFVIVPSADKSLCMSFNNEAEAATNFSWIHINTYLGKAHQKWYIYDSNGNQITATKGCPHNELRHIRAKYATCTEEGNEEYWYCSACDGYYGDAGASNRLDASAVNLPAMGHSYRNGVCSKCASANVEYFANADLQFFGSLIDLMPLEDWVVGKVVGVQSVDGGVSNVVISLANGEQYTYSARPCKIEIHKDGAWGMAQPEYLNPSSAIGREYAFYSDALGRIVFWTESQNFPVAYGSCGDDVYWTLSREWDLVIYGEGSMDSTSRDEYPWFEYSGVDTIKTVNVRDGVTAIGDFAFYGYDGLRHIQLGRDIRSIPTYSLAAISGLVSIDVDHWNSNYSCEDGILFNKERTKLYIYPAGREQAAYVIPETVEEIGRLAFCRATNLTDISIPANLKAVGNGAFSGCKSLENLYLEDLASYLRIPFTMDNSIMFTSWSSHINIYLDGVLTTDLVIPAEVEQIPEFAFMCCVGLKSVTIPDGVRRIEKGAFSDCVGLETVKISGSVTKIGDLAFAGCSSLQSVEMQAGVQIIDSHAFMWCNALESVVIPSSVTRIGELAFFDCSHLNDVYFQGNAPEVSAYDGGSVSSFGDAVTIYYIPGTVGWTDGEAYDGKGTWNGYELAVWKMETSAVADVVAAGDGRIQCIVNAETRDFEQVLVGIYDGESGAFIAAAMGTYDGCSNTVTVSLSKTIPDDCILKVFCVDDSFAPQYQVSRFSVS